MAKTKKYVMTTSMTRVSTGLQVGSRLAVADNTGAKEIMIINVPLVKTRLRRVPDAGVGDLVVASVKKGTPQLRKQVVYAVIIRQKKPYRRPEGYWVSFEDNAAIIVNPDGSPRGTEIRGPVAKEAAERWPRIAKLATMIV
ncbi:MAG: 50S ribosomal protein L14 [Acidilobaceae archaeon]